MLVRYPVESLEVAFDPIFKPISLNGEQLNNRAGNRLIRMKYTELQVHVLSHTVSVSTHESLLFPLGPKM